MSQFFEMVQDAPLFRRSSDAVALSRRPVVAYCAVSETDAAIRTFAKEYGRKPAYLCFHVVNAGMIEPPKEVNIPIILLRDLPDHPELLVWVFGAKERGKGILLAQHGIRDFVFAVDPPYGDYRYQPELLRQRRNELERLFHMLADEESRLTFASIVKQRIRGEHGFLRIARYGEYFHPKCKALPGEYVVDAGACDGRTSLAFAREAPGGRVFAFEPDKANQSRIQELLAKEAATCDPIRSAAASAVTIAPHALFDKDTMVRFAGNRKGSSSIADDAEKGVEVSAVRLDSYVERNAIPRIDVVSIDVEGAEAVCLKGMRGIIERFRPKLQVSIYHKKPDLYELPFLVESMCKDYTFFLGHHNTYSTETDLYAVPNEQIK